MTRDEFTKWVQLGITKFIVARADSRSLFKTGEIIELKEDDGSNKPAFWFPNKEPRDDNWIYDGEEDKCWCYFEIANVYPWLSWQVPVPDEDTEAPIKETTDTNAHYVFDGIQPIEYCQKVLTKEQFEGACIKDIIKYLSRFGKKDEKLKEAKKVIDYALWLAMSVGDKKVDPMKHNHTEIFKALGIEL